MCHTCQNVSRRSFLAGTAATLFSVSSGSTDVDAQELVGGTGTATLRRPPHYRNISWNVFSSIADTRGGRPGIPYPMPLEFTREDRKKLSDAMLIVAERFLRPDIFATATRHARCYPLDQMGNRIRKDQQGRVWVNSSPHYPDLNAKGLFLSPQSFLQMQFAAFWNMGFPGIDFYAWRATLGGAASRAWAWAPSGTVDVSQNLRPGPSGWAVPEQNPRNPFSISGRFKVHLSLDHLRRESTEIFAGVIAHEMLHNLSHVHPNGYLDDNLVTVFGDILGRDGQYVQRQKGLGLHSVGSMPECG